MTQKISVGPILGVESESGYTVCFLLSEAGVSPRLVMNGSSSPAQHVANTPSGRFFRAELHLPTPSHGSDFQYSIESDGVALEDSFGRSRFTFHVPGRDERICIAYASCNGFSSRPSGDDPYALWRRMKQQHEQHPFSLLVMGGDQLYADEIWTSERAPRVVEWYGKPMKKKVRARATQPMHRELDRFYESLYLRHWAKEDMAFMMASVPSVMMWDDHDIFDGWGSYPKELQECDVYQAIFAAAAHYFELFQIRSLGNRSLLAPGSGHYSFALHFRGHAILGLDNRSERNLEQVMSRQNWADVKGWLEGQRDVPSLLVMSAVPVVYRSFSRAEAVFGFTWWQDDLADDVLDHWGAGPHAGERVKLVVNLLEFKRRAQTRGGRVVILSGDVHVGGLGVIVDSRDPERRLEIQQVTSSAIVHPAPSRLQWLGILAGSSDAEQTLEPGISAENLEPVGSDKFIRTRNYAMLEEGTDGKLWVEWVCEDGQRREYAVVATGEGSRVAGGGHPSVNEEELSRRMERDVEVGGFAKAIRANVADLARVYRERPLAPGTETRLLSAWARRDPQASDRLDHLPAEEETALRLEMEGVVPDLRGSLDRADFIGRNLFGLAGAEPSVIPELVERNGEPIKVYRDREFENWGRTDKNRPALTCVPRTIEGVRNIVRWAAAESKAVRVAGYRHTWGKLYSADHEVLISTLPVRFAENLPAEEAKWDPENELQVRELVGEVEEDGVTKALCRVGAGLTNEMFREWLVSGPKSQWKEWTVPLNVIMVEITFGGSNGPICHGAGRDTTTLSDLVHEIEFVNAKGNVQTVSGKELETAAGCFGLLGVVVSLTLKLVPMTYAEMRPTAPRVALAVPPPAGFDVPKEVDMEGLTSSQIEVARQRFVSQCESDYYSEWFWFAFSDGCWVNCWNNTGTKDEAEDYPGPAKTKLQEVMEYLAHLANKTLFRLLPSRTQAEILGGSAMRVLPKDERIVTPLIDALHFQRGIQNMRVYDMEFEIPIPADANGNPDWSICQRAWWDVIKNVYERDDTPMRLAMEMRITGDSKMTMAPQHGNQLGTCSIEVLTPANVPRHEWEAFMQDIADRWSSYTDANGNPLNVRPHWAKEWQGLTMRGKPIEQYLKEDAYPARIAEFKAALASIAAAGGYTIGDLQERFSNPLLRRLFFD